MARAWLVMVLALGLSGFGATVSRTSTVFLSIPAISVVALPDRGVLGREIALDFRPEEVSQGSLVLPLAVRSNVPWALTVRVLGSRKGPTFEVKVADGPEVPVGEEEIVLLSGRPGKHEVSLKVKIILPHGWESGMYLVFQVRTGVSRS